MDCLFVSRLDCEMQYSHRLQIKSNVREYHRRVKLTKHFGGDQDEDWTMTPFRWNTGLESRGEQISDMVWELIKEDREVVSLRKKRIVTSQKGKGGIKKVKYKYFSDNKTDGQRKCSSGDGQRIIC